MVKSLGYNSYMHDRKSRIRLEGGKSVMNEGTGTSENRWPSLVLKLSIVTLVFPVAVLVFHVLLVLPSFILLKLITYLGGSATFWATALSVGALFPAGYGALLIGKMLWPK